MGGPLKKITPYVVFAFFCLIFSLGLLLFQHIPLGTSQRDSFNVHIYGPLYIVFNTDSPEFIKDANFPVELLGKTSIRQSRPGLILLVAGLDKLIYPFHVQDAVFSFFKGRRFEYFTKEDLVPYFTYTLLNYIFLFVSFFLFLKILNIQSGAASLSTVFLSGFLVWNDLTKAFLFTPHTQIFNLLAPLFCLYVFQGVKDHDLFNRPDLWILAFLAGLGVTAYATFLLFIPSVILALGWIILKDRIKIDGRMVLRLLLVILLTVLPYLAWVLYVYIRIGSFYQFEMVHYQQFVWILPLLRSAPASAVTRIFSNLGSLAWSALRQAAFLPLILLIACLSTVDRDHGLKQQFGRMRSFGLAPLVLSGLFLLFFALAGLLNDRLAFSAVPPLVVGTAAVVHELLSDAAPLRSKLLNASVILLACLECLIILTKVGPFA